ncbi:MAG: TOPRIM nucleotidyl transferase/hydrolase domain-containing protein [Chloroflexota bacterium]
MTALRLASISTHGVQGLPDLDLALQPVTALIGPRGSGKSSLLRAASWLLSGTPSGVGESPTPTVRAELLGLDGGEPRTIERGPTAFPADPLPPVLFLATRDRLPSATDARHPYESDAASAEAMVAAIAERRLSGVEGEVLLIEEPELMLTVHQQRHFYNLLHRYAERNQVIYSSRSPAMLDAANYQEIVRLDVHAGRMNVRRAARETLTDEQRVRLEAEFDHERTEMFFASAVVLVEGQTEAIALPLIFRRLGHHPDALGISVVEVGGKGNLPLVARLLAELGIPHLVVFDSDRGHPGERENRLIKRAIGKAPVFLLDPDFEGVAGIKDHDEKVLNAWRLFSEIAPKDVPPVLRRIVDKTIELANRAVL